MDLLLPKTNDVGRRRGSVTEQVFQTLRPGEHAGFYIPIPNRIIRSPRDQRKIFRALKRAIISCIMTIFMGGRLGWVCNCFLASGRSRWLLVCLEFGCQSHAFMWRKAGKKRASLVPQRNVDGE